MFKIFDQKKKIFDITETWLEIVFHIKKPVWVFLFVCFCSVFSPPYVELLNTMEIYILVSTDIFMF